MDLRPTVGKIRTTSCRVLREHMPQDGGPSFLPTGKSLPEESSTFPVPTEDTSGSSLPGPEWH